MENIKLDELEQPVRKIVEHMQDALFHLGQAHLTIDDQMEIGNRIQEVGKALVKALRDPKEAV